MSNKIYSKGKFLTKGKLLTISALLFGFGLGTSAVATSAWYAMYDIATLGDLNMRVNFANDGWLNLTLYKDGLPVIDEEGDGYSTEELGFKDKTLGAVSGMFEVDWYNETTKNNDDLLPRFHSRYKYGLPKQNSGMLDNNLSDEAGFYVQNVFYFESGSDMEIYLDESAYVRSNVDANNETAFRLGFDERRKEALNNVVNAVRVSFLTDEGYIVCDPGVSESTYFGGILDLNKDGYFDCDDNDNEILYGEWTVDGHIDDLYSPVEEEDVVTDEELEELKNNNNTFIGSHRLETNKVDLRSEKLHIAKESSYKLDSLRFDSNDPLKTTKPICHLNANEKKRIVVSVYVEGWNEYMTDDIDKASFDINITFTGLLKH